MTQYYVDYPRGFANEYTVYAVDHTDAERLRAVYPNAVWITRRRAVALGWSRVKQAARDGEQWFGGFKSAEHFLPSTLADALDECRAATMDAIIRAETECDTQAWNDAIVRAETE